MNAVKPIIIAKRDGSLESFAAGKLRRVLSAAMRDCRLDTRVADPLVQAVEVHLRYWDEPRPPTAEYVFRCVHAVLRQTGLTDVAERVAAHRRWRRVKRQAVRVLHEEPAGRELRPWRKAAVVAALESRCGLSHTTARIVASELEMRVLNLGYRTISQHLLDELMRNELLAWGLWDDESPAPSAARQERRPL